MVSTSKNGMDETKAVGETGKLAESMQALKQALSEQPPSLEKLHTLISCCSSTSDVIQVCEKSSTTDMTETLLPTLQEAIQSLKEELEKSYPENTRGFTSYIQDLWLADEKLNLPCYRDEKAMACIASAFVRGGGWKRATVNLNSLTTRRIMTP